MLHFKMHFYRETYASQQHLPPAEAEALTSPFSFSWQATYCFLAVVALITVTLKHLLPQNHLLIHQGNYDTLQAMACCFIVFLQEFRNNLLQVKTDSEDRRPPRGGPRPRNLSLITTQNLMRGVLSLIVLFGCTQNASGAPVVDFRSISSQFDLWAVSHGKTYATTDEYAAAMKVYLCIMFLSIHYASYLWIHVFTQ